MDDLFDDYAKAAAGPPAQDVANVLIRALGWDGATVTAGALPHQARILNTRDGVWLGITSGVQVQFFAGQIVWDAEGKVRYTDPIPGTESTPVLFPRELHEAVKSVQATVARALAAAARK